MGDSPVQLRRQQAKNMAQEFKSFKIIIFKPTGSQESKLPAVTSAQPEPQNPQHSQHQFLGAAHAPQQNPKHLLPYLVWGPAAQTQTACQGVLNNLMVNTCWCSREAEFPPEWELPSLQFASSTIFPAAIPTAAQPQVS